MTNLIQQLEKEEIEKSGKNIPKFRPGDTLRLMVRVVEGTKERLQAFVGLCIARSGGGYNQSFTVRKISSGEGVERVFPLYSPILESMEVIRFGKVRRAKLHYIRQRSGKSARIKERKRI